MPFSVSYSEINDGHFPGKAPRARTADDKTNLAVYNNKNASNFLTVFDGLLPDSWCEFAYEYMQAKNRPWGVYITREQLIDDLISPEALKDTQPEVAIGLIATRSLIRDRARPLIGEDFDQIHGTVVWCLTSGESASVEYHIDYAELFRYETNIIHPPLYAGTMHLTNVRNGEITGGDFRANCGGLAHYRKFGYKGRLATSAELAEDLGSNDWITVKYRYNRGIFHDGDFPHLSTPVTALATDKKRVILGFNCFSKEVGECCERAPEHSSAFNKTVKLYQTLARLGQPISNSSDTTSSATDANAVTNKAVALEQQGKSGGVSAKDILKNPALARILVMAAKRVKEAKVQVPVLESEHELPTSIQSAESIDLQSVALNV